MWKSLAVVLVGVMCVCMWFSRAVGQEANLPNNQPPADTDRVMPDGDLPRRAARDFVPWIEAIIQQKSDVAHRLFPLKHQAQEVVESPQALRIFRKFPKLNGMEISLIGGRTLGDQTGVLLFTTVTDDGPVAFKIYHYRFGDQRYVGKIEITDDWGEIEKLYLTVDILQNPVTVPL